MARPKRRAVPSYRHHKPTDQAVVTFNGVDYYLGRYDTPQSKEEYARLLAEYAATGLVTKGTAEQAPVAVVQVLAAFWKHAQIYYSKDGRPTSELAAYRIIVRDTKALYGSTPAEEFGPLALKAVRQSWIDRGQSRGTVNKYTRRIVHVFRWAVSEEIIPVGLLHALQSVPGLKRGRCDLPEPARIRPVALTVVERTLPHMTKVVADMVRCQLLAGMRPAEVCSLRPCDLDREDDVWEYRPEGHKTEHHGRERVVFIGPECQAILTPYLLRDSQTHCFSPRESVAQWLAQRAEQRTTPPGPGRNAPGTNRAKQPRRTPRTYYDSNSYRRAIHRACDAAFPPESPLTGEALREWQSRQRWSPNRLRHTKGTEIRKRFGLEAAQVILGHAAADVTQVYAERDADKAREVARQVG